MKFEDVERNKEFYINRLDKKGNLVDWSKFKIGEDNIIRIWFRFEKFWINAPDNRTEAKWFRAIEKYGVRYVED